MGEGDEGVFSRGEAEDEAQGKKKMKGEEKRGTFAGEAGSRVASSISCSRRCN